jgi:MFS family permease
MGNQYARAVATASAGTEKSPIWRGLRAPEPLTSRQRRVVVLLALACFPSSFVNTVFTQTVAFAASEFGVGEQGQGFGAAVVRWGVIIALPLAGLADRVGRRTMILATAWLAPLITSLGAFAPSFPLLVATQTLGRPLGIALNIFVLVFAVEEMGSNSRAWALSILAMASGIGAGSAVAAIPLAGLSESSWRFVYLVGLGWLVVAAVLTRRLPETERFDALSHHTSNSATNAHIHGDRLALQIVVAILLNVFIATASIFQIRYLKDVRGYSAAMIALYNVVTVVPASIGLVIGGRLAETTGRKTLAAVATPLGALLIASAFGLSGFLMWTAALLGGISLALAYPAMSVFRNELFPTAKRSIASAMITTASLLGGSAGLIIAGILLERDISYFAVMLTFASGPVLVAILVAFVYPETAHRKLEDLNPEDAGLQAR